MGSINAGLFITLDGVTEAPQTWQGDYFNDEMGAAVGGLMTGNDGMLLGRHTYDEFASFWPHADQADPTTAQMNATLKYVVSTTLEKADWENTTVVSGDIKAELLKLKQDNRLGVTGSATLVRWLLQEKLIDELHLFVHPVAVGAGKRLFEPGEAIPLRLIDSTAFSTGVLHLVYGPVS
ncbi:dihydrofolate reductase family protein [Streptosporangium lutulentum]|uniref:Dihydrofolate reductase n=1 Tax=Streptosporangium lutulentum TaxID=1461250 RepID=A0ABT9QSE7_9ACTN|nr:dihydrofolate reductase family protein [Streptosporangium lutulentum]MDP9849677.1 dihydrofolate reductase [Streptosporangium lutulentum]